MGIQSLWGYYCIFCLFNTFRNKADYLKGVIKRIEKARNDKEALDTFFGSGGTLEVPVKDFRKSIRKKQRSLEQCKSHLITLLQDKVASAFTFATSDFCKNYPSEITIESARYLLNELSLQFGELKLCNPEHFFLNNPIWTKPIIKLEDDKYFLPAPEGFITFCLEIFEGIVQKDTNLYERHQQRRSRYLEDKVQELFESSFPDAKVFRGSLWTDPVTGKEFENDLLVVNYLMESLTTAIRCVPVPFPDGQVGRCG